MSREHDLNTMLDIAEARLQRAGELLREAVGWMEGVEPKPAAPFLAECRAYFSEAPTADPAANAPPASELHPKVLEWTRKHHPERLRPEDREAPTADREEA